VLLDHSGRSMKFTYKEDNDGQDLTSKTMSKDNLDSEDASSLCSSGLSKYCMYSIDLPNVFSVPTRQRKHNTEVTL